jgi:hypothetical protein
MILDSRMQEHHYLVVNHLIDQLDTQVAHLNRMMVLRKTIFLTLKLLERIRNRSQAKIISPHKKVQLIV